MINQDQIFIILAACFSALLVFLLGRASKRKNDVCLTTEDEVFRVAETQINNIIEETFFRSDVSDEEFADSIAQVRAKWRPFIKDIQTQRLKKNKKI